MADKLSQNIILLIITIIVFIIFLEIGARIMAAFSPKFLCSTYSDPNNEFLCQMEAPLSKSLERYNQTTATAYQNICDKLDTQLGWVPKPNCRTKIYSTNSKGFRGSKEYNLTENKKRIVLVGDSFTWGENSFDNETFPFYLEKLSNGSAEAINMGVHGYGPDQFYIYFMRDGLKYKPDAVVFGLFLPDIHRTIFKVREYFKPRFILENGKLKLDTDSTNIPDLKTALQMSSEIKKKSRLYSISYLYGLLNKAARRATSYRGETRITLKIIDEIHNRLKKENIEMVVVLIPEQGMVEGNNKDYYGVVPQITANLEKENIGYINLQLAFRNEFKLTNQSLYRGHLKPAGNLLIAKELLNYLNAKKDIFSQKSK